MFKFTLTLSTQHGNRTTVSRQAKAAVFQAVSGNELFVKRCLANLEL